MDSDELIEIIESRLGFDIDDEKKIIINHGPGPVQVVAGPGSGKTELLTILVLKRIFCDEHNPKSIIITTFTEKGAKNLRDRIVRYADYVFSAHPEFKGQIDLSGLRIGTLHSLCSNIMQEYRYEGYENFRLMDGIEQYLFVYDHIISRDKSNDQIYHDIWANLPFLFDHFGTPYRNAQFMERYYPGKASRTRACITALNRVTEDLIDVARLKRAQGHWTLLAELYEHYMEEMEQHKRCDFATLQKKFLNFLDSAQGEKFVQGDGTDLNPGIFSVLVDEYQDTNPIQEKIYFKLAKASKNLCVVGDDDQALYRFRGGTVECLVNFDQACERFWGVQLTEDDKKFLVSNYRSHKNIIDYYNQYIRSFPVMRLPRARVEAKPEVVGRKEFKKTYPSVCAIYGEDSENVAQTFAQLVRGMLNQGIIQKSSQCVLLMYSVRGTDKWAGPFAHALREQGITPYNPRAKTFLDQEEICGLLGTFIQIVDPELKALNRILSKTTQKSATAWVQEYERIASDHPDLARYVQRSTTYIQGLDQDERLPATVLEIVWRILSYEPFSTWMEEPSDSSYRLAQLTKIFESYCSVPLPRRPGSNRSILKTSSRPDCRGEISRVWLDNFYYSIIGLLAAEGMDDPEDEEIIVPEDQFPIMTIHQSKGLEFDFVFIYRLNKPVKVDTAVLLEDALAPFREVQQQNRSSPDIRAEQDLIRLYYVAYSRAKYTLIHLVPEDHIGNYTGFVSADPGIFRDIMTEVV